MSSEILMVCVYLYVVAGLVFALYDYLTDAGIFDVKKKLHPTTVFILWPLIIAVTALSDFRDFFNERWYRQ